MRRVLFMLALVVAGEAIFGLPFHVTRFFRRTVLDVFGLTNTELGAAQAIYGITAMLAYFPGGPLADRFSSRKLLCTSLLLTTCGGLYMATFPDVRGAMVLWGFYGVSTILFFWAALIRATREWGGTDEQGRAFGLLDGGRGLLAAVLASLGVVIFSFVFPDNSNPTLAQKEDALRIVIYGYAAATFAAALLVWFFVPDVVVVEKVPPAKVKTMSGRNAATKAMLGIRKVVAMPMVWMQAIIVLCAYVGFKGFDIFALFAFEVYGMREDEAARLVSNAAWLRPVAAVAAGLLADRIRSTRVILIFFALLLASELYFALVEPDPAATGILLANVLLASAAVFALRGVYFALFNEAAVPHHVTGTAVGLVSVVGYTPDIFVMLLAGVLLDRNPGLVGYQHFFFMLAAFAALGLLVTMLFIKQSKKVEEE